MCIRKHAVLSTSCSAETAHTLSLIHSLSFMRSHITLMAFLSLAHSRIIVLSHSAPAHVRATEVCVLVSATLVSTPCMSAWALVAAQLVAKRERTHVSCVLGKTCVSNPREHCLRPLTMRYTMHVCAGAASNPHEHTMHVCTGATGSS